MTTSGACSRTACTPSGPVDGRRGVPGPGQVGGDQPGQRGLVLDDQHLAGGGVGFVLTALSLPAQERTSSTPWPSQGTIFVKSQRDHGRALRSPI